MPITGHDGARVNPVLTTERLTLRLLKQADASDIARLADDWEVARHTALIPHPYTFDDATLWIERSREGAAQGTAFTFAITRRGERRFIGAVGLHRDADGGPAVMGYWLGRPYWADGVVSEAVDAVLEHAFDTLGIAVVRAAVVPQNIASARVLEKAGFTVVGHGMEQAPARGPDHEVDFYETAAGERGR